MTWPEMGRNLHLCSPPAALPYPCLFLPLGLGLLLPTPLPAQPNLSFSLSSHATSTEKQFPSPFKAMHT